VKLFSIIYLTTIGLLALYGWFHFRTAFIKNSSGWVTWGSAFAVILLTYLPYISKLIWYRWDAPIFIEYFTWVWLAWMFWTTGSLFFTDCWNWLSDLLRLASKGRFILWQFEPVVATVFSLSVVAVFTIWGIIELGSIRLKEIHVSYPDLPESLDGYRILMFSDLHLNHASQFRIQNKLINYLNNTPAVILVSCGDFLDGDLTDEMRQRTELLVAGNFPDGRYGIYGNNDAYAGAQMSAQAHEVAQIHVLSNTGVIVRPGLWLAGVDDPDVSYRCGLTPDEDSIPPIPEGCFGILLKHRPTTPTSVMEAGYRLMLSGHTHGGQIFPFGLPVRLVHGKPTGKLFSREHMQIYVSPGTGYWGMPFRVLSQPEVTLITLHRVE